MLSGSVFGLGPPRVVEVRPWSGPQKSRFVAVLGFQMGLAPAHAHWQHWLVLQREPHRPGCGLEPGAAVGLSGPQAPFSATSRTSFPTSGCANVEMLFWLGMFWSAEQHSRSSSPGSLKSED